MTYRGYEIKSCRNCVMVRLGNREIYPDTAEEAKQDIDEFIETIEKQKNMTPTMRISKAMS